MKDVVLDLACLQERLTNISVLLNESYMKKFLVDVDNDQFVPEIDPISSHSRIAGFYKFRPPYIKDFFLAASKKLNLGENTTLLDICCGRGELASQFCDFSKEVYAVDGSEEMLKNKINRDNVRYFQCDINRDELAIPDKVDHVVIGSAIHWVKQATLERIIANHLGELGKFLVAHTLFRLDDEDYFPPLQKLNEKFGKKSGNTVDLWGAKKMEACNYKQLDQLRLVRPVSFGIEYLFLNQMSYAYDEFFDKTTQNFDRYKQEFVEAISPFVINKNLSGNLVNWGVIYGAKN